jgi:hypothetical protein
MAMMRGMKLGLLLLIVAAGATGCVYSYLPRDSGNQRSSGSDDPVAPPAVHYAVAVDWEGSEAGASLQPGMAVTFSWDAASAGSLVRLELFRDNARYEATLSNYVPDAGSHAWTVPLDIELHDADLFQAKLTIVDGAVQTTVLEERYSPPFAIVRVGNTGGLSDVTVGSRRISITLTDDGSLVDGDRVDVYLNGVKVVDDHALVGGAGTVFPLDLLPGSNELRVTALNEGTSSPNTARMDISGVTVGAASQSWRLLTGESGSLVISCAGD